jgi:hypothetical protein
MAVSIKMAVFWDVVLCSLVRILPSFERWLAVSETSVNFCLNVWHSIPEGSCLEFYFTPEGTFFSVL